MVLTARLEVNSAPSPAKPQGHSSLLTTSSIIDQVASVAAIRPLSSNESGTAPSLNLPSMGMRIMTLTSNQLPANSTVTPFPSSSDTSNTYEFSNEATGAIVAGIILLFASMGYGIWAIRQGRRRKRQKTPDFSPPSSHGLEMPVWNAGPSATAGQGTIFAEPSDLYHHSAHQSWWCESIPSWPADHSPSPQPALAEVQAFTKADGKPKMCTVGRQTEEPQQWPSVYSQQVGSQCLVRNCDEVCHTDVNRDHDSGGKETNYWPPETAEGYWMARGRCGQ